jgi:hypothetical protein
MRLREMLTRVQAYKTLPTLNTNAAPIPSGAAGLQIGNLNAYAASLRTIVGVPPLTDNVRKLLEHSFLTTFLPIDTVHVPQDQGTAQFIELTKLVETQRAWVERTLEAIAATEDPTTLAVYLPHVENAESLADEITAVGKYLENFVGFHFGETDDTIGEVKLTGFDVGSEWLVFLAHATEALTFIGLVVRAGMRLIDWGIAKAAELKALQAEQADTQNALEHAKTLRRLEARKFAQEIVNKTNSKADNEEVSRLRVVIDKTSEMIERRYKFQATRKALPATLEAFPSDELQEATAKVLTEGGTVALKLLGVGDEPPAKTD